MDTVTKKLIGTRINSALALRNIKQKELAKHLEVSDNTVSYFVGGSRVPNMEQLIKISKYLNVSTDYLLGLTDVASTDTKIKDICEYTGLDEEAIAHLHHNVDILSRYLKETDNNKKDDPPYKQFLTSKIDYENTYIDTINRILNSEDFSFAIDSLVSFIIEGKNNIREYFNLFEDGAVPLNYEFIERYLHFNDTKVKYYDTKEYFSDMIKNLCEPTLKKLHNIELNIQIDSLEKKLKTGVASNSNIYLSETLERNTNANNNETE